MILETRVAEFTAYNTGSVTMSQRTENFLPALKNMHILNEGLKFERNMETKKIVGIKNTETRDSTNN